MKMENIKISQHINKNFSVQYFSMLVSQWHQKTPKNTTLLLTY